MASLDKEERNQHAEDSSTSPLGEPDLSVAKNDELVSLLTEGPLF